jgi:hypothetical protein
VAEGLPWTKTRSGQTAEQAEGENAKLKRLVGELSLEKQILKDVAEGNFEAPSGGGARSDMHARTTAFRSDMPAGGRGRKEKHNDQLLGILSRQTLRCKWHPSVDCCSCTRGGLNHEFPAE